MGNVNPKKENSSLVRRAGLLRFSHQTLPLNVRRNLQGLECFQASGLLLVEVIRDGKLLMTLEDFTYRGTQDSNADEPRVPSLKEIPQLTK